MKRITLIVFVMTFACAAFSFAQGEAGQRRVIVHAPGGPGMPPSPPAPLGKWWKNSDVAKELQLSDAQIKQIEQTFLDYRMKLIDLKADVERQELKLQPLIEADRPDEQQVGTQVDAVLAARAKLEKTNTMMMLAIRKALSVEQWKKLQAIQQKREGPFFTHFGGPGAGMGGDVMYFRRRIDGPESAPLPPPPPPGQND